MKNSLIMKLLLTLVFVLTFFIPVSASENSNIQNGYAESLVNLKLLQGYEDGNLRLDSKIKRSEFVTFAVRITGHENENDLSSTNLLFKDISKNHWAYNNVKIALKYKFITGYPDNTIAPDNFVTYGEALTVIIRSLGYESSLTGKWPENVVTKSEQLGITKNLNLPHNKQLTRGEMTTIVYNSLTVNFNK